jgi:hypothetical protein
MSCPLQCPGCGASQGSADCIICVPTQGLPVSGIARRRRRAILEVFYVVEAGGVGPTSAPHSKQLIDSAKLKSVMIRIIFRSWHNPVTKCFKSGPYSLLRTSHTSQSGFHIREL